MKKHVSLFSFTLMTVFALIIYFNLFSCKNGLSKNEPSSADEPIRLIIELYQDHKFQGDTITITYQVADLDKDNRNFGDKTTSFKIKEGPDYKPGCNAYFYRDPNFRSDNENKRLIKSIGEESDLRLVRSPNNETWSDTIDSIKIVCP
jgi:hypothetical protein